MPIVAINAYYLPRVLSRRITARLVEDYVAVPDRATVPISMFDKC
jgi:hypothetical protein